MNDTEHVIAHHKHLLNHPNLPSHVEKSRVTYSIEDDMDKVLLVSRMKGGKMRGGGRGMEGASLFGQTSYTLKHH